jgi:proteasome assembly chaperone (PAC2) family protein
MTDGLVWERREPLRRPLLVAAFSGWNDAGDAATGVADWLVRKQDPRRIAYIDPDEHVDYQSHRPQIELVDGVTRAVTWPANDCFAVALPERDLVVLRGIEPNVRWRSFCNAVLAVARETDCEMVVTIGALLGDVPHTRRIRCTGSATDEVLSARLGMQRSQYEGPTGIVGVLHDAARKVGFASASIWAPVPHYVATAPNPKATHALLERLGLLLDVGLELTDLEIAASAWERSVDEVVAGDADAKSYVERLEQRYDEANGLDAATADDDSETDDEEDWLDEDDLPSGESLAEDFERYLREQHDE